MRSPILICRLALLGGLSLLSLTGLTACSSLVTVKSVQQQPQRNWLTETVKLRGQVGSLAPLLKGQVYELQDATGKIWVLSSSRQVTTGQQVLIRGRVRYEAIEVSGQDLGEVYIEEQQVEEQQVEELKLEPSP